MHTYVNVLAGSSIRPTWHHPGRHASWSTQIDMLTVEHDTSWYVICVCVRARVGVLCSVCKIPGETVAIGMVPESKFNIMGYHIHAARFSGHLCAAPSHIFPSFLSCHPRLSRIHSLRVVSVTLCAPNRLSLGARHCSSVKPLRQDRVVRPSQRPETALLSILYCWCYRCRPTPRAKILSFAHTLEVWPTPTQPYVAKACADMIVATHLVGSTWRGVLYCHVTTRYLAALRQL